MSELPLDTDIIPELPLAEEVIPEPRGWLASRPLAEYFSKGWRQGMGERPFGLKQEDLKAIQENPIGKGFFGDLMNQRQSLMQEFYETVLLGPIAAGDAALRTFSGLLYGTSEAALALGLPRDLSPAALLEASPAGRFTSGVGGAGGRALAAAGRTAQELPGTAGRVAAVAGRTGEFLEGPTVTRPSLHDLDTAAALGIVDKPRNVALDRLSPFGLTETPPWRDPYTVPLNPIDPLDIHIVARAIQPDIFARYDELTEQRLTLHDFAREIKLRSPESFEVGGVRVAAQTPIEAAARFEPTGTPGVYEPRLVVGEASLDPRIAALTQIEKDISKIDTELQTLSPAVKDAYRAAADLEGAAVRVDGSGGFGPGGVVLNIPEVPVAVAEPAQTPRQVRNLAQRATTIARDTAARLEAVGRPADEARAAGRIVQALYVAHAERFDGALGTARELYERDAPKVRGEEDARRTRTRIPKDVQGFYTEAINTITLMRSANASTFVHEVAHNWLQRLVRDVKHEAAPAQLKTDMEIIKKWVGAKGDTLTRAQHEKFARGFERYLMEGQAPSQNLVGVFEKFRKWMTDIYQTVAAFGRVKISDDVRGVYDRLLAAPRTDPVIVAERPGARTWVEDAEASVRETPAAEAAARADRIAAQIDQAAQNLPGELDARRREARGGPATISLARDGESGAGVETARTGVDETTGESGPRRSPTQGKSETPPRGSEYEPESTLVDRAGNIRVENLAVPDDVGQAIFEAAERNHGFVQSRRGVLSEAETIELAAEIGLNADKIDRWRVAEAWTAEQIVYARALLRDAATRVRDAAKAVEAGGEDAIVAYALERERLYMIQEKVSAVTAETGRAMRAFRMLEGEKDVKAIADFFQKTMNLTPAELRREARLMAQTKTTEETNKLSQRTHNITWKNVAASAYINGLVSGPDTHIVNIASNLGVAANVVNETAAAAIVNRIARAVGRTEEGVSFQEISDRLRSFGQGSVDGLKAAKEIIMDENKIPLLEKTEMQQVWRGGGTTGKVIRFPGRMLAAEDEFFKAIAWQSEINVMARRMARNEGLAGDALEVRIAELRAHPTESMIAAAEKFADVQTFTNPLGKYSQYLQYFANSHPLFRFLVPFIRTPINLLKYAHERTPFGLLSREIRDDVLGKNGAVSQDTAIGKLAVGTMIGGAVGTLTLSGMFTGGGPRREEERVVWGLDGKQPYSFKIPGTDLWLSYRRFDPAATIMGLSSDLADLASYPFVAKDPDYEKAQAMTALLIWRNLIDKLSLSTVTGIVSAATSWEQHGQSFISQYAGSFVPGILAQPARWLDPLARDAREVVETLYSRVPGVRETLKPKRDVWGEEIPDINLGPVMARWRNDDPVNLTMQRLGMSKGLPERKIQGVELTPQQYDDYTRISGRLAKQMLDQMVTPQFQQLPEGIQIKMISGTIDDARKMGRAMLQAESLGSENDLVAKALELQLQRLR